MEILIAQLFRRVSLSGGRVLLDRILGKTRDHGGRDYSLQQQENGFFIIPFFSKASTYPLQYNSPEESRRSDDFPVVALSRALARGPPSPLQMRLP